MERKRFYEFCLRNVDGAKNQIPYFCKKSIAISSAYRKECQFLLTLFSPPFFSPSLSFTSLIPSLTHSLTHLYLYLYLFVFFNSQFPSLKTNENQKENISDGKRKKKLSPLSV